MSENEKVSTSKRATTAKKSAEPTDGVVDELVELAVAGKATPEQIADHLNKASQPLAAARDIVQALANRQGHATSRLHDIQTKSLELLKTLAERAETDAARVHLADTVCKLARSFSKDHVTMNRSNNNATLKAVGLVLLATAAGAVGGYSAIYAEERSRRKLQRPT